MRRLAPIAVLFVVLLAPSSASAQSSDPDPDSPSGNIYEIPLEAGRGDAAPGRRSRGGRERDERSSSIHSDNGFGSSPNVPGTSEPAAGGGDAGADAAESEGTSGGGGSSTDAGASEGNGASGGGARDDGGAGDGSGKGSDRARAGETDIPEGDQAASTAPVRVERQEAGSPSIPRAFLLLGLGVLVAAGLAAAARLALRRR